MPPGSLTSGARIAQQEVKTAMANVHTDVVSPGAIDTVRHTIFAVALFLGGTFSAQARRDRGRRADFLSVVNRKDKFFFDTVPT